MTSAKHQQTDPRRTEVHTSICEGFIQNEEPKPTSSQIKRLAYHWRLPYWLKNGEASFSKTSNNHLVLVASILTSILAVLDIKWKVQNN